VPARCACTPTGCVITGESRLAARKHVGELLDTDTIPITPDLVRGALELEHTQQGVLPHRLPAWARAQGDGQLAMAEAQPSGVRLALRTRATVVELDTLRTREGYRGIPPRPDGVYDLLVDGELTVQVTTTGGKTLLLDMATGAALGDDRLGVAAPAYGEGDTEPVLHPKRGGLQAQPGVWGSEVDARR
jgi:hypothetical protein